MTPTHAERRSSAMESNPQSQGVEPNTVADWARQVGWFRCSNLRSNEIGPLRTDYSTLMLARLMTSEKSTILRLMNAVVADASR